MISILRIVKSVWSINNQRRVEKLIQDGRMTPAGLKKITEAKENGEWDAAIAREDVSSVPDDLVQELENNVKMAKRGNRLTVWLKYP